jgi:adenylate kinase
MEAANKKIVASIKHLLGSGSINIFGLPFAGKDTHGKELANMLDGVLISGGDILRSDIGPKHIKEHSAKGYLAPSDEYIQIISPYFQQASFRNKPLILSSVGRWSGEEKSILEVASLSGHEIKVVIYLKISENEVLKRWQLAERGRHDDKELHILQNRFLEFSNKTLPVIQFYKDRGLLIEIDAMPKQEDVTSDILAMILARLNEENH